MVSFSDISFHVLASCSQHAFDKWAGLYKCTNQNLYFKSQLKYTPIRKCHHSTQCYIGRSEYFHVRFAIKPYVKFFYSGGIFLQNIQLLQNEYIYKCANIWWDFIFFLQLKLFRPFLRIFFFSEWSGPTSSILKISLFHVLQTYIFQQWFKSDQSPFSLQFLEIGCTCIYNFRQYFLSYT